MTHEIDEYNEILVTGVGSIDDFSINVPDEYDPEQQATLDQVPIITQQTNTIGVSWKRRNKYGKGFSTLSLSNNRLENDFRRFEDNVNQTGLYLQNLSTEAETKFRYNRTRFKGNWTLVSTASLQFSTRSFEKFSRFLLPTPLSKHCKHKFVSLKKHNWNLQTRGGK